MISQTTYDNIYIYYVLDPIMIQECLLLAYARKDAAKSGSVLLCASGRPHLRSEDGLQAGAAPVRMMVSKYRKHLEAHEEHERGLQSI